MAKFELESADLAVNIASEANISANVENAQPYAVTLGKAAQIDAGQAVTYIESGKAEVRKAVAEQVQIATTAATNAAESAISAAADADRAEAAAEGLVSDKTFVFEQGIANDTWNIVHNMGKHPSVFAVDSAGSVQIPNEIIYISDNEVTVTFLAPFAGKAYLN